MLFHFPHDNNVKSSKEQVTLLAVCQLLALTHALFSCMVRAVMTKITHQPNKKVIQQDSNAKGDSH